MCNSGPLKGFLNEAVKSSSYIYTVYKFLEFGRKIGGDFFSSSVRVSSSTLVNCSSFVFVALGSFDPI